MFILIACQSDVIVKEEFPFEHDQWIEGDVKLIEINAPDTSTVYQMNIGIQHSTNYPFQNLYIKTITTFPSGKEIISVASLELASSDGSWAGDCSGDNCSIMLTLQDHFTFPETGVYQWQIEPYMRMDTVQGIKSIEVICQKPKD